MSPSIVFPALKFIGDKQMVAPINYQGKLIADKNWANHYYPTVISIVDAKGQEFLYQKVEVQGGVLLLPSIRYVARLYEVQPILIEPVRQLDLEEYKQRVIKFSAKGARQRGLPKEELTALQTEVQQAKDHATINQIIDSVSYWK